LVFIAIFNSRFETLNVRHGHWEDGEVVVSVEPTLFRFTAEAEVRVNGTDEPETAVALRLNADTLDVFGKDPEMRKFNKPALIKRSDLNVY
jgi:hypothetical protein